LADAPRATLRRVGDSAPLATFGPTGAKPRKRARDSLPPPEIGSLVGPDGSELFYRLRRPKGLREGQRRPAIVHVYGGPGVHMVQQRHMPRADAVESRLAAAGFVVFALDSRGSSHRGKRFEGVLKGRLGVAEIEDQAAGARFLQSLPFVDPKRIGIFGA